jgi:preprotein translocase subunit SecD
MARQQGWFALILALAIAAGALLASFPLQLGLDLRGGSQLTLQVMPAGAIKSVQAEQLEAVKEVLERRINGLGVAESSLQTIGSDQLMLQLPGEQDPSRAARVLGTTALLEFRAQKPGTEERMQELLKLKRQAQALQMRLSGKGEPDGGAAANDGQREAADLKTVEADLQRLNADIVALYEPAAAHGQGSGGCRSPAAAEQAMPGR